MYPANDGKEDLYVRMDLTLQHPMKLMPILEALQLLNTNKFPEGDLLRVPQSSYRREYINDGLGYMPAILVGEKNTPAQIRIYLYPGTTDSLYFNFMSTYQMIHLAYQGSGYLAEGYDSNQIYEFVKGCHYILGKALNVF